MTDKDDNPQIVEKVSNTKLKKKQNTRVENICYRKGSNSPNTLEETFSTNKSFWVYLWDTMLMKTPVALPHTHPPPSILHSSSIKVATLTQVIHPLYIYSTSAINSLLLWVISRDMLSLASCNYSWQLKIVSWVGRHIPSPSLKQI